MKKLSLFLIGCFLVNSFLFAGGQTESTAEVKSDGEAPMLAAMVEAGELPSVTDRMPVKEDIMVIQELENIGTYGGEYRMGWVGISDKWDLADWTEEPLFMFDKYGQELGPNVAKAYDVNEDSTEFLIYLREGMKWSDGVPFTADDIIFYWEHMLLPGTFGKDLYGCYYSVDPVSGDKARADVTKVDDYTVKVTHEYPNPLFLQRLHVDNKWFFAPAHYYKTILPEFIGEEAAMAKAQEKGYDNLKDFGKWTGYYYWVWPERPTLRPWVASNDPRDEKFVMTRNPYYWKTDSAGNQLPYMDTVGMYRIEPDLRPLSMFAGEIDYTFINSDKFTFFKSNEKDGVFNVLSYRGTKGSTHTIELNQTIEDENLRPVFQDVRFRQAISHSIDRDEYNALVFDELLTPRQASILPGLAYYSEEWENAFTEYNPGKANALLDEMGLKWDSAHEYRLLENGNPLQIILYLENAGGDEALSRGVELIVDYSKAVGINFVPKYADNAYFDEMKYANKLESCVTSFEMFNPTMRPDLMVPLRVLTEWQGLYGLYNSSNGAEGVKPEGDVALIMEYWNNVTSSTNQSDLDKWMSKIVDLHANNIWSIGLAGNPPSMYAFNSRIQNVEEDVTISGVTRYFRVIHPEQFYISE